MLVAATDELSATSSNDRAVIDQEFKNLRRLTNHKCYLHRDPLRMISNSHLHWLDRIQRMHVVEDTSGQWLQPVHGSLANGNFTLSERSNQSSATIQHVDKLSSLREVAKSTAYTRER